MKDEIIQIASKYFNTPAQELSLTTPLKSLEKTSHDLILFSFEIEQFFSIEFEDSEVIKLKKLGDYVKIIKSKLPKESEYLKSAA
jgi:acyl carrier protein